MKQPYNKLAVGVGIGLVNGAFGGGGGMLAVPALTKLGLQDKQAHATAILVILPVCLLSLLPYLFGGFLQAELAIPTALGVLAGGGLGAKLLFGLPTRRVGQLFALLQALAGIFLIIG